VFDRKTALLADLVRAHFGKAPARILVVGCGSGREAAQLALSLRSQVVGIDLQSKFDGEAAAVASLRQGDATALDFCDNSFDFVYSFHALEHIPDFRCALREMHRVLTKDGAYCIGTPNRDRLVGYLGSKGASWRQKLEWNLADWRARLRGRFRNEYGAHAGFTYEELQQELTDAIGPAVSVTLPYYLSVYARRKRYVALMDRLHLSRRLFPAVYFVGQRRAAIGHQARSPNNVSALPLRTASR
jgi:SAM-dependent methyltransferase